MTTRTYEDACGIARALDVIGERWALLVVRELIFGPKRFTDLRAGLRGISQNVLSQRLKDLESAGIVRRTLLGPPASSQAYELTPLGRALEPALVAMSRWGALTPPPPGTEMSNDAFALALKALFVPARGRFTGRVRMNLVRDAFDVEVGDESIEMARASASAAPPAIVVEASEAVLRDVIFRRRTLDDALASSELRIVGGAKRAAAFLERFERPETLTEHGAGTVPGALVD